jgi:1-deoxy-D-xylulose-5-phosphate synthase
VHKNGGHLGSNLGAIEIITAFHYVFDCPIDRIVFDVGHQAYAHKLLTGRRELMENLRNSCGASGFPDPTESVYDHFIAGHASTSVSAALGIAVARDMKGEDFKVISMLGDGSLSGGMVYEAMNNVTNIKNFIIILNDNQMSISESVGSMRLYLSKLLNSKKGLMCRKRFRKFLSSLPKKLANAIKILAKTSITAINNGNIFEELGIQYIGPIDGHNIAELIDVFKSARDIANYKPIIIHAITQKGKGYAKAERDPVKMHGVRSDEHKMYSDVFGSKIKELATNNQRIVCITAAMKDGYCLRDFAKSFPERFFDVGIAEEHAVTFAAGLAKEGLKPFVCIYSTFLQRAIDQVYHDVFLQDLPVRFIIDKAGMPGGDGRTHSGLYDVSLLQNFPSIAIISPTSKQDLEEALDFAATDIGFPLAIRFPKVVASEMEGRPRGGGLLKCDVLMKGIETLVIACGSMVTSVIKAVEIGSVHPTILGVCSINPFDFETFYEFAKVHERIFVFEEGVFGGISNVILEHLIAHRETEILKKVIFHQASKFPVSHMTRSKQLHECNLSPESISRILCRS